MPGSEAAEIKQAQIALASAVAEFLEQPLNTLEEESTERWMWFFSAIMCLGIKLEGLCGDNPALLERLRGLEAEIRRQKIPLVDSSQAAALLQNQPSKRPAPSVNTSNKSSAFSMLIASKKGKANE